MTKVALKDLVELTVPQNLLISIISPIVIYVILNLKFPGFEIVPILISLSFAVLGFNSFNMIYDIESDKIDKPNRPLPSGRVSKKQVYKITKLCFFISFLVALFTNISYVIVLLVFIIISYLYSAPLIRIKKYLWATSFTGAFQYAIIPFLSAMSLSPSNFSWIFFIYFINTFLFISNVKDIEDIEGEKKNKINSIPIKYGIKKTYLIVIGGPIILNLFMFIFSITNLISKKFTISTIISIIIYVLIWQQITNKNIISERITTQSKRVTLITIGTVLSQISYAALAMF